MSQDHTKLNILINAYSIAPNMGSEPGMAWNWIINLSKYNNLYVITEGRWKDEIQKEIINFPYRYNINFYFNPVSHKVHQMTSKQGDWRFYYYYRKWQKDTLKIAEKIIAENKIDVIHQLNLIGFREPGYLWKIDKPFVWGPVDAKEKFPTAYLNGSNIKQKLFIHLKNNLTKIQFLTSTRIKNTVKNADIIFGASSESVSSIKKFYHKNAILLNETGCYYNNNKKVDKTPSDQLNLLWVGKLDFRKQLGIALNTIVTTNNKSVILHIVGDDSSSIANKYKTLCKKLKIEDQCIWYGKISHAQVQNRMKKCDLLFFTSVAEVTTHLLLESLSNNLPVLCFNTCGQGDTISEDVGIKIPLSTPSVSIKNFASIINSLYTDRKQLSILASNCKSKQKILSWENKVQHVTDVYKSLVNN